VYRGVALLSFTVAKESASRIAFPVTSCSGYSDRRHASMRDMEDIAWVLRSDPRRNQIGFVPAKKLKPQDRYVLPDEWD
jgi:hypothetical protein